VSIHDINVPAWMAKAACTPKDTAIFFLDNSSGLEAKAICRRCPVAETCLAYALEIEEAHPGSRWGVYGGVTARQRRILASKKKKAIA